jgi:putative (di)nucleoside polyphosphate hydrolase
MIDQDGYRLGVGFILQQASTERLGKILLAERLGKPGAWQFPQGGIQPNERPIEAMYRELYEELGLQPEDVVILKESGDWHRYELPDAYQIIEGERVKGQTQRWFLLKLMSDDHRINLSSTDVQEFGAWRWANYWEILDTVVEFKRALYQAVLTEFAAD